MIFPVFVRILIYLLMSVVLLQSATLMPKIRGAIIALAGVFGILSVAAVIKSLSPTTAHDSFIDFAMTPYLLVVLTVWMRTIWRISVLPKRTT